MPEPIVIEMYSKPGCHLCDAAKDVIESVRRRFPFDFRIVDIELDPTLKSEFGSEIPVVFINGSKTFKYHVDPAKLEKKVKTLWKK